MAKRKATKKKTTSRKSTKKKAAKKSKKKQATKKAAPRKKAAKKTKKKAPKKSVKASKDAADTAARAAASAMREIITRARDHFRQAPPKHVFVLANGSALRNVFELAEALDEMHDHVFHHHVNDHRHDFANWVHEILHERALADELRKSSRSRRKHQNVIYRHIVRRVW